MLAIIGGTGLYQLQDMQAIEKISVETPFGMPSSEVVKGTLAGREILFLSRHGTGHRHLPHEINYRANIFALKLLGARQVIGISAVGSLREEIVPGDLAIPSQYFDWTRGHRASTFFGNGVAAHVSTARPVSENLMSWIAAHASRLGIKLHAGVVYGCVEGPRLGTVAESHFLRAAGCDLVGMTNIPEVFLAREAQLCYATIGIATDYDCWMEDPSRHVTANAIFGLYGSSLAKVQSLLISLLQDSPPAQEPEIRTALSHAMMTAPDSVSDIQRSWLEVLQR
ncbi:MAG: S-methyl-5'-thioinosine phosphorylase [Pseudomonadota bacterium]